MIAVMEPVESGEAGMPNGWKVRSFFVVSQVAFQAIFGGAGGASRRTPLDTGLAYPFTHTTCLSVCTTSTRSFCASITASMSL
jgi:hypothetical protein